MFPRIRSALFLLLFVPFSARAVTCADVLKVLGSQLADVTCFQSTDLTTNNPLTTPADNSLPGVPARAFTPITDRGVIAPSAGKRTPITKGTRPVTAELALLFGRAFVQSPQYWLNLQAAYDLKTAQKEIGGRLRAVRPLEYA